jgi:hypothetical protein
MLKKFIFFLALQRKNRFILRKAKKGKFISALKPSRRKLSTFKASSGWRRKTTSDENNQARFTDTNSGKLFLPFSISNLNQKKNIFRMHNNT